MELSELTCREEVLAAFEVYKDCMYLPTEEKYRRRMEGYLSDPQVRIFACRRSGKTVGMAVVSMAKDAGRLMGIAVTQPLRRQGIGAFLLRSLALAYAPLPLLAETDADAVGFYRSCGCTVTAFTEIYDGDPVTRYRCLLKADGTLQSYCGSYVVICAANGEVFQGMVEDHLFPEDSEDGLERMILKADSGTCYEFTAADIEKIIML